MVCGPVYTFDKGDTYTAADGFFSLSLLESLYIFLSWLLAGVLCTTKKKVKISFRHLIKIQLT